MEQVLFRLLENVTCRYHQGLLRRRQHRKIPNRKGFSFSCCHPFRRRAWFRGQLPIAGCGHSESSLSLFFFLFSLYYFIFLFLVSFILSLKENSSPFLQVSPTLQITLSIQVVYQIRQIRILSLSLSFDLLIFIQRFSTFLFVQDN